MSNPGGNSKFNLYVALREPQSQNFKNVSYLLGGPGENGDVGVRGCGVWMKEEEEETGGWRRGARGARERRRRGDFFGSNISSILLLLEHVVES